MAARYSIALLFLLQGCETLQPFDDWTKTDTRMQIAYQALNAIDASQTRQISDDPTKREVGPIARNIIGKHPSHQDVAAYFIANGIAHYLIAKYLPPKWRRAFMGFSIAESGRTTANN